MGKLMKKKRISKKEDPVEIENVLPEKRNSDDKLPKKVNIINFH